MAQPLVATYRIEAPYTVSSQLHKLRVYVKPDPAHPGPPINILYRNATNAAWTTAAARLAVVFAHFFNGVFGTFVLEQRVGIVWNPVDSFAPGGVTYRTEAVQKASQITLVLRDSAFFKLKVIAMEGVMPAPYHDPSVTSGDSTTNLALNAFATGLVSADDPNNWQVSRGERYMLTSASAGYTVTLNHKMRRRRGLT